MEVFAAACRAASERFVPFVIECVPKALKLSTRHLLRGDISRAALVVMPMIAAPAARCEAAPPLADSSAAAAEAERHAEALINTATRATSRRRDGPSAEVVRLKKAELAVHAAMVSVALGGALALAGKWLLQQREKRDANAGLRALLRRLGRDCRGPLPGFDEYEARILGHIVDPDDVDVAFEDIGGIDAMKSEVYDLVVLPLHEPELFAQKPQDDAANGGGAKPARRRRRPLAGPATGVLFYGAPGTGKTMLAKAIALESKAVFINVRMSVLMDKYFGESQKLAAAVFSVAQKLAPAVIFLDELDAFLKRRGGRGDGGDDAGAAMSTMKAEFLSLWDGVLARNAHGPGGGVVVLGATNRPHDVDAAFLRRLPRQFEVPMPDAKAREAILARALDGERLAAGDERLIADVAARTDGFSGSDLVELCRTAAFEPVRELAAARRKAGAPAAGAQASGPGASAEAAQPRAISRADFFRVALKRVRPTGSAALEFGAREDIKLAKARARQYEQEQARVEQEEQHDAGDLNDEVD